MVAQYRQALARPEEPGRGLIDSMIEQRTRHHLGARMRDRVTRNLDRTGPLVAGAIGMIAVGIEELPALIDDGTDSVAEATTGPEPVHDQLRNGELSFFGLVAGFAMNDLGEALDRRRLLG